MGIGSFLKKAVPKEIRPGTSGFTTAAGIGSLFIPELGALALGNAALQDWAPKFTRKQIGRLTPIMTPVTPTATPAPATPPIQSVPFAGASFGNTGGVPMRLLMPPGGFEGAAQQSAAVKVGLAKAAGRKGGKRSASRRRKKNGVAKSAKRRRSTSAKRGGRVKLKKGSPAAKAWGRKMAAARKKR